ncbi:MAG: DUF1499 domain-containing protein [Betaproteobacteria bacterium]
MFDWRRPSNLGVRDGRLAPCRRTPNCVSSQADPADRQHYIPEIVFRGHFDEVRQTVAAMRGATLIRAEGGYLYAEFRTPLMRFVDDFEVLQQGSVLHVRSSSRLGRRDFGVNRRRVEALRALIRARR